MYEYWEMTTSSCLHQLLFFSFNLRVLQFDSLNFYRRLNLYTGFSSPLTVIGFSSAKFCSDFCGGLIANVIILKTSAQAVPKGASNRTCQIADAMITKRTNPENVKEKNQTSLIGLNLMLLSHIPIM